MNIMGKYAMSWHASTNLEAFPTFSKAGGRALKIEIQLSLR